MADDLCGMEIGTPVYRCPNEDCSPDGWHKCMVPRGHETLHRCECGTMWVDDGPLDASPREWVWEKRDIGDGFFEASARLHVAGQPAYGPLIKYGPTTEEENQ